MNGDRPSSPLALGDALERLLDEARPKTPALWEDVSGGLHPICDHAPAPGHALGADALDAFSAGHDLTADAPFDHLGYALLDDAGGLFAIDADTGIVRLKDPQAARSELGRVCEVRVRQPDGYEATFHLRIAEPLPEVVFSDGVDPFAAFAPPPLGAVGDLMLAPPPPAPMKAWTDIAAALGALRSRTTASEAAPFGAALGDNVRAFPAVRPPMQLCLDEAPPEPAPQHARWFNA